MSNYFEVTDPRGKIVVCSQYQWDTHISNFHGVEDLQRSDLIETIQNPAEIYRDAFFLDRECYYRFSKRHQAYIKITVELHKTRNTVITAYKVDSVKKGEKIVWPR